MRPSMRWTLGLALLALGAGAGAGRADVDDYLTKGGKLTAKLVVRDVQGGFAGFTGREVTIAADGEFTVADVFNKKVTEKRKGKLSKKQLTTLAKELDRFNLNTLKAATPFKGANPHVVTITFGKKSSTLTAATGALPKPDPKTLPGRYAGIVAAVDEATKGGKKPEK